MNDVLLIHRIIPKENPETKHPMTFITGEMEETRQLEIGRASCRERV